MSHNLLRALLLCSLLLLYLLGYHIPREHSVATLSVYGAVYLLFFFVWKTYKASDEASLIAYAVLARIVLFFTTPELSNDFYRFLWDGFLSSGGLNPYLTLPVDLFIEDGYTVPEGTQLIQGMGSFNGCHYTPYFPVNQMIFYLSTAWSNTIEQSIWSLRIWIMGGEVLLWYSARYLLTVINGPKHYALLLFSSPLLLVEMHTNLHFESLMMGLTLFAFMLLHKQRWFFSALILSLAIGIKALPLLVIPFLWRYLGTKQWLLYGFTVVCGLVLCALPWLSLEMLSNIQYTIQHYFTAFEFNASLYYIAREVGYWITGYNQIAQIGSVTPWAILTSIVLLALHKRNQSLLGVFTSLVWCFTLYFFLASIVHPWYLAIPLCFSLFTSYRFIWLWCALTILSYSAYASPVFQENTFFLWIEYGTVFLYMIYEIRKNRKHHQSYYSIA